MKKNKNNLDEMQEKKLLKIEHNTLIITITGLFIAVFIQQMIYNKDILYIIGEGTVLFISCIYLIAACIKNGIWDRKTEFNMKTNTLISLIVSLLMGLIWGVISYYRYHQLIGSIATFAFMFLFMFALLMVIFAVLGVFYRNKKRRIEKQADEDEYRE